MSISHEMPVALRRQMRKTDAVAVRIGEPTDRALTRAGIFADGLRGPGWSCLPGRRAERLAELCRVASKPDRSDPWPNGYRTALRRLADQIDARLQGERT